MIEPLTEEPLKMGTRSGIASATCGAPRLHPLVL